MSFLGLNKSYPVSISNVMQANDHMSAERLYFEPVNTSGPLYCLVWISVAKWWCYQQALPKSAILTLKPFSSFGPLSRTSFVSNAENSYFALFPPFSFFSLLFSFLCSWSYYSPFSCHFLIFLLIFFLWFLLSSSSSSLI